MALICTVLPASSFPVMLGDSALRAVIFAAAAGVGLALFRVRSSSLRLLTWTGVLYAALAMPLLTWIVPRITIPVPSVMRAEGTDYPRDEPAKLSSSAAGQESLRIISLKPQGAGSQAGPMGEGRAVVYAKEAAAGTLSTSAVLHWFSAHWKTVASGTYLAIALLLLARLCAGLLLGARLVRRARIVHEARLAPMLAVHSREQRGYREIYESDFVTVPVTVGIFRSKILLPASWKEWDSSKLDGVLAHELSHVVRRDALTQFLSRVHRAMFWFSPLAWWLDHQLTALAEEASDEAALSGGADRAEYARTLLSFLEILQTAPGRVWWQGVSMAKSGQAEHRLERILSWRGVSNMRANKYFLVTVVAIALPAVYVVAAARPADRNVVVTQDADSVQSATPPAIAGVPAAPSAAPAVVPVAPRAPERGVVGGVPAPALPAAPAIGAIPTFPVMAWSGQGHGSGHGRGFAYAYGFDDEQRFVIVSGNSDTLTMSGSSEDARHVQRLKKQIPGDFIWFQRDEKSYIIRDPATIDRARKLWAPQEELGKKQEELGKLQEALGKQQEELGAKMEQVRVNVPDMTAQLDALKAKLQKLGPTATMEQLGDLQSEIGELQSKIGEIQSHAGDVQGKFGAEQGALGEKQGKLGEQQGELGRQQAELAEKATKQMKELFDEAIKNGTAKPEPGSGGEASL
jgi:beta-lactamase regulating signal transducer with metallopeptidase domain